ncbi:unnamed protein product, partial [marine sediment metagenome]
MAATALCIFYLALVLALSSHVARPFASTWDESAKRSRRTSVTLCVALVAGLAISVSVVLGSLNALLARLGGFDTEGPAHLRSVYDYVLGSELWAGVFLGVLAVVSIVQLIRGLASLGGGKLPKLEPLCTQCGYGLQGGQEPYLHGL